MDKPQFAWKLRMAREEKGLTQTELGGKCGLMPSHISHFESGRRLPSLENFRRIAFSLGVSADYILGLSAKKRRAGQEGAGA